MKNPRLSRGVTIIKEIKMSETIAAISTAMMPAGIGIVRISGDGALEAARKIWQGKNGKTIEKMAPYTAALGIVSDANEKNR